MIRNLLLYAAIAGLLVAAGARAILGKSANLSLDHLPTWALKHLAYATSVEWVNSNLYTERKVERYGYQQHIAVYPDHINDP